MLDAGFIAIADYTCFSLIFALKNRIILSLFNQATKGLSWRSNVIL